MVEITIEGDKAVFQVQGWDKLWSLRSRLEISLRHIDGVYADPKPAIGWFRGFKVAGANIPNIFKAGIFHQEGNLVFWDVQNPEKTIVVELADERFAKLIVEVPAPDVAVSVIKNAMAHAKA